MTAAPISATIASVAAPAIMAAQRWVEDAALPPERPLLNLAQAVPAGPPPAPIRDAIARAAQQNPDAHLYGPVLGNADLRAEVAARWSTAYGGQIAPQHVAITAGCNQAFCAAVSTLAAPGEAVMLAAPWYFNHKMWLDMSGIGAVALPVGDDCLPSVAAARRLLTPAVKAIALISPNNPTGVEYPADLIAAFRDLARRAGVGLILDETYRDFHSSDAPPHSLFTEPDWQDGFIHLYSFSKAFRLTGHRVGALIGGPDRIAAVEKFLDTVTICAPQLGQHAALFGLREMGAWVAEERAEVLRRRAALQATMADRPGGWRLLGAGAYFGYLEHPFHIPSDQLAPRLVANASVLLLPATMFEPSLAEGGPGTAERRFRVAFANVDAEGLSELGARLAQFQP